MKTSRAISIILAAVVLLLTSCSKSSDPSASTDPRDKWVGTWTGHPLITISGNPCDGAGTSPHDITSPDQFTMIITKSSFDASTINLDSQLFSTTATTSSTSAIAIPSTIGLTDVTGLSNFEINSAGVLTANFYVGGGSCTLNGLFIPLFNKYYLQLSK